MAMWQLVSPMGGSRVLFGRFACLGVVVDGICRIIEILDEIFQSGTFLNGERDGGPP